MGVTSVFDDPTGSLNNFLTHRVLRYGEFSSIRMLDLGTSVLRHGSAAIDKREAKVILETAIKLFPDLSPKDVMHVGVPLPHEQTLVVLDKFAEYLLELASIPKLTRDDLAFMEHGLPQLLGWCPYFNHQTVYEHLASLFREEEAIEFMINSANQMRCKYDKIFGVNTPSVPSKPQGGTLAHALTLLAALSTDLRGRGMVVL